ncbi:hypothetical protein QUF72_17055 [Desulfobacterales bacterium HSG2]|nr:hypothetical protein [Desulfobacterales bacterium HSG2]
MKVGHFLTSAVVDSGSELKKCPIFSILPGMTGHPTISVNLKISKSLYLALALALALYQDKDKEQEQD